MSEKKIALITGITGQDGSYLAELLLRKGYAVHGLLRRSSSFNTARIDHIFKDITLHYGDMLDSSSLCAVLARVSPDEVYNLAAQSHVKVAFEMPEYTAEASGVGVLRIFEAIRTCKLEKKTKLYQASTSEMYGKIREKIQDENTPFYPRSPYGVAKVYAYWTTVNYREAYGMYAVNGILFNHESPRRGKTFVTRKITRAVSRIAAGKEEKVMLGNLSARRDWGHAEDYVRGMWLCMQQEEPEDLVLATGVMTSVRDFCYLAFGMAGMPLEFEGEGLNEVGIQKSGQDGSSKCVRVSVDERYFRPSEVDTLLGSSAKAFKKTGWKPSHDLETLVYDMLRYDMIENGITMDDFPTCMSRIGKTPTDEQIEVLRPKANGAISPRTEATAVNTLDH